MIEQVEKEEIVEKDYKDLYIRLLAEFDNYKKRVSKEKSDLKEEVRKSVLSSILELDNELFLASKIVENESIKVFSEKLKSFLSKSGIEEISLNEYDPDIHEVISVVQTGETKILDVISKGYYMDGKIIKYPKIVLSK